MDSEATFFQMTGITKSYWMGDEWSPVLRGIDLTIREGEFLSVLGPSGSGKSTLMNIIGCLDTPTSGEYILHGRRVDDLDADELARIRNQEIAPAPAGCPEQCGAAAHLCRRAPSAAA